MNEEDTRKLSEAGSFERRVLARFDSIDQRLDRLESHNYDTKPIWERALKEILETRLEVGEVRIKFDGLETKFNGLETKFNGLETKFDGLETKVDAIETKIESLEAQVTSLKGDYGGLHKEMIESQRDFKVKITRRIDLVLETLVDTRNGMRDADERLTRLESKLA